VHPDVIISGAGIIGLSLALELHERGASVIVLERGEPGRESSSAAAGMLAPSDPETPRELRQLAEISARAFPEFIRKIEAISHINTDLRQGSIVLLPSPQAPPDHKPLAPLELEKIEPQLNTRGHFAFALDEEQSVYPELLMRALIAATRQKGIELRDHTAVKEFCPLKNEVEVVTGNASFTTRAAVNCQGAWSGMPVRPRKGQMLYLRPEKTDLLKRVVRAPEVYLVPRSSGKILVGATVEDVGFDKTVNQQMIEQLHRYAADYVPELASASVVESWAGLRPGTPDDLPVLGATGVANVFIASGHFRNGILLAPATAGVMADLIAGKSPQLDLSSFSPQRFAAAQANRL
jgi:glycine oxidase